MTMTMLVVWFRFMVFNATFNNISAISWRSVLLVEETRVLGENHRPVAIHRQTVGSYNVDSLKMIFYMIFIIIIFLPLISRCLGHHTLFLLYSF